MFTQSQKLGYIRLHGTDTMIAFKEFGHLLFGNAHDFQHLSAPAFMLHIQQEHTGGIGIVTGMNAGEYVVYIIFRKHDLCDPCKVLRFVFPDPENFRCGETGKGDICGHPREFLLAHLIVEIVHLRCGSAVIPKDRRANHIVILIQDHQAVHLTAAADTGNGRAVKPCQQFRNALQDRLAPILRVLLAPAGFGKLQGIFFGDHILNLPQLIHQQQLCRRGTQIDTDIQIHGTTLLFLLSYYMPLRKSRKNPPADWPGETDSVSQKVASGLITC